MDGEYRIAVENQYKFELRQLLWLPNLLSLSRLLIAPVIGYLLWRGDDTATIICLALLVLAGITDFLDGWLARRLNKISPLGIMLDPLADKFLAIILIVELVLFREFPLWLAILIVGRDLLIVILGLIIMRDRKITLPSNITGKYYFAATVVLIGSYIINFNFGQVFMTVIVLALFLLSGVFYAGRFIALRKRRQLMDFHDRATFKAIRIGLTVAVSMIYLIKLYVDIIRSGLH